MSSFLGMFLCVLLDVVRWGGVWLCQVFCGVICDEISFEGGAGLKCEIVWWCMVVSGVLWQGGLLVKFHAKLLKLQ